MDLKVLNKIVGEMLRKVRISSKLTQDTVAKSIGISRRYVIKIEKGQAENVSLNVVLNYLNACNVKWADFFVELEQILDKINYERIIEEIGLNKATGLTEKQKQKINRDISYYLMRISGKKGKAKPYSEKQKYKAAVEFGKYRIKIEPIEDEIQKKLGELNVPIAHNQAYKDFARECYKALKNGIYKKFPFDQTDLEKIAAIESMLNKIIMKWNKQGLDLNTMQIVKSIVISKLQ